MTDAAPAVEVDGVGGLTLAEGFDAFVSRLDEPEELLRHRREARERYLALGMPTRQSEEWRYTDVTDLEPDDFRLVAPGDGRALAVDQLPRPVQDVLARDQARSAVAVTVNGAEVYRRIDEELAEKGVIYAPLARVARERPELLERLYTSEVAPHEEKIWALHVAALTEAQVLFVPRGVSVEEPVHTFRYLDRDGGLLATHTLVVAEEGAAVTCAEEFLSPHHDEGALSVSGIEVFGGANADVNYISLQRFGRGVRHFSVQHATSGRDARLSGFNVALGADLHRADVTSHLEGPGSESEMLALWFGDGEQHVDHHTLQHHAAPHAYSDLLYKGALTDSAESVFRGMIRVDEGAQLTDAYQTNRNLLLSERSHANTLPNLEIKADDVRCSHGATVGQVDESHLFYLMSRGLTRQEAERLLVFGFFDEVLNRVPVAGVQDRVREAIEAKIGL